MRRYSGFFLGGWGGGMENKSSKVCEMLALLLVLYDNNHKADFTNHKTDNRKNVLSYNILIPPLFLKLQSV